MNRLLLAFLKSMVVTVGFDAVCFLYGAVSGSHYEISLPIEVILFLVIFVTSYGEYLLDDRNRRDDQAKDQ
ncbi:MAG TPA: hypothetical protein IAA09_07320 [Candidatus Lachnoclostridium avicola]|nr:hypothetical protein [Candidatus Lachnoclostridium avicola]